MTDLSTPPADDRLSPAARTMLGSLPALFDDPDAPRVAVLRALPGHKRAAIDCLLGAWRRVWSGPTASLTPAGLLRSLEDRDSASNLLDARTLQGTPPNTVVMESNASPDSLERVMAAAQWARSPRALVVFASRPEVLRSVLAIGGIRSAGWSASRQQWLSYDPEDEQRTAGDGPRTVEDLLTLAAEDILRAAERLRLLNGRGPGFRLAAAAATSAEQLAHTVVGLTGGEVSVGSRALPGFTCEELGADAPRAEAAR